VNLYFINAFPLHIKLCKEDVHGNLFRGCENRENPRSESRALFGGVKKFLSVLSSFTLQSG
jgi:hypothetical protein